LTFAKAQEAYDLANACAINKYGTYFDRDPYFYLENAPLVAIANILVEWHLAKVYLPQHLTYVGYKYCSIIDGIIRDYQEFVTKLNKK